jgi:HEPN domain-containing protein
MSAERVIANSLRLAQADLDAAELLHAGKNRCAIYHCEQAAEKIIKAVLTSEGVHANIKHQLDDMVKQVPDANPLKSLLKQIEHLAAYATRQTAIDGGIARRIGTQQPAATSSHRPTTRRSKPIWPASTQPSRQLPPRSASN